MATLVIAAVGAVVGGIPFAGVAAAALTFGAQSLFGSSRSVSGPRLSDLAVQSSAYGTPLPRLYGAIRASGSVIWATDIRETSHRSGGGKGKPKTTTYSYAANFAVALSARPIKGIGRVWGDGKLMRSASGQWIIPATMRVYKGTGGEQPDPLIVSAEGSGACPAYRGMAYVVFEELDLTEFANHIPSLSFEVFADDGAVTTADIIDDLAGDDWAPSIGRGDATAWRGFGMASAGSIRSALDTLAGIDPIFLADDGNTAALSLSLMPEGQLVERNDLGAASASAKTSAPESRSVERAAASQSASAVQLAYYDTGRDYQTGLQRAHFGSGANTEQMELPAALSAGEAKAIAERKIIDLSARKASATIRLPYRALALRPGDIVRGLDGNALWRIHEMNIERMVVEIGLQRVAQLPATIASDADSGRVASQNALPNGETLLEVMDLPPLFDEMPLAPRVWIAAGGRQSSWRRADISMSLDAGASWEALTTATGGSVMGATLTALPAAGSCLWDDRSALEIELAHDGMWVEGRPDDSVLAGGNLALVDDELIQFGSAEALGGNRFRLSHLLRGRRGTEWAAATHAAGGRFVMIDPAIAGGFDLPLSRIGSTMLYRAAGPGDDPGALEAVPLLLNGRSLQPPSPVHLNAVRLENGDIHISWIRRSRQGWSWIDGVDAPLSEEREVYQAALQLAGGMPREITVADPVLTYSVADQVADGGTAAPLAISIAQLSTVAGAGVPAEAQFNL